MAIFRAAVAWEIPSSLATRHGGAAAVIGVPDDLGLVGVHPLGERSLPGQQFRRRNGISGVLRRQGADVDDGILHGDDQPLNEVFQLADVARPVVLIQKSQKPGTEGKGLAVFPAEPGQELMGQRQHVLLALAQGRDGWMRMTLSR